MLNFIKIFILLLFFNLSLSANENVSLQLLWKHQFEFAGFYVAQEKGYYSDVGLHVEIKEFNFGTDIVEDIVSGKSDFGIGRASLVLSKLKGKDILLLNALYQSSPYALISKKRSDLQTIEDFKGKKIMLSGDLASLAAISSMIKIKNLQASDYIQIPHSFDIHDLITDKVDIMTTYISNEPFHLKEQGVDFTIYDPKDYGFDFYSDILFTSQKYLDSNSKRMLKFQEASLKGFEYAFTHIDETVEIILQKYNSQNKTKAALIYEAKILKDLAIKENVEFASIDDSRIKEIANIYRLLGMTKSSNEKLKNLIYKPNNFFELFKKVFTLELFIGIILFILIINLLSLYKQYILKKQNIKLEDIVSEKTKELLLANETLEEKIQERTKELESAIKVKSDFLANMSHEIRTPLNGIIGFIDILYKDEEDQSKSTKLKTIHESSHMLLRIINDILDFSKIESNKIHIDNLPFNLSHVFTHTVELFFDKAKEKEITIDIHIDNELPEKIVGDKTRVTQVFSNLLSNAIKFSDENSIVTVNIKYMQASEMLYCEIIDKGLGISSDKIETIFNSFEQADNSVTRIYGGTGLGLSISKALVEHMGGAIGVNSTLGVGSTFYFTLKLIETKEEIIQEEVISPLEKELKGLILIVEDNKTNQMLLEMLLDDLNLEYEIANDGLEAVEAVKTKSFNMILMDENMPNMNGIEATKIIRKLPNFQDLPIIAVTANALIGDREKFIKNGMNDYISKPIDINILNNILQKYLSPN